MTIIQFGKQNKDVILLLHGGGLSWWNYRAVAKSLEDRYHVVLPVLDGHADSDMFFTTIEENAKRLIGYVDEQFGGKVFAIAGLSLGGQIATEMLSQKADICKYALLESVLVKPMKLTASLIGPSMGMSYGLVKRKWFAKMQFAYLRMDEGLFEDYYRDTCKISKGDMVAFLKANSTYTVKPSLAQTTAQVRVVAGGKEQKRILESAKLLSKVIPESSVQILNGLYHGQLSINNPKQYVQVLESLWK